MPEVRGTVIKLLMKPQYLKVAIRLVREYNFDPEQFPLLMNTVIGNSANHYISRVFRPQSHPDYMSLHKVEDLFTDRHCFLTMLVEALVKKERLHEAFGVWMRHNLEKTNYVSEMLKEKMKSLEYDVTKDK